MDLQYMKQGLSQVKQWVLQPIVGLVLALVLLGFSVWQPAQIFAQLRPGAELTYALDDPYIHLAIAKNWVQHGVYGVTPERFTPSSSSLLWTLLLAGLVVFLGPQGWIPLGLALLFAGMAVWAAWRILRDLCAGQVLVQWAGLLLFVVVVPLAPLVLSGMETSLQVFLTLAFAWETARILRQDAKEPLTRRAWIGLVLLGMAFSATRYEHLALIALAALGLLLRRRWGLAAALLGAALLPVVIFGLVSMANGWFFFPSSVMVKAFVQGETLWSDPQRLFMDRIDLLWSQHHLQVLVVPALAGLLISLFWRFASAGLRWLAFLFIPAAAAHVLFGHLGWFYRYEAYIVGLGWVVLVSMLGALVKSVTWSSWRWWLRAAAAVIVVIYAVFPLAERGMRAWREIPGGMTNIYDQQIQMMRFLRTYYAGQTVAINDIGAISLWGEVGIIDLAGLGTVETARALQQRQPLRPVVRDLVQQKGVKVAIIYQHWFPPDLTAGWTSVGTWTVEKQVTLGGATVIFYAVDPREAQALRQHLLEFSPNLPPGVRWQLW